MAVNALTQSTCVLSLLGKSKRRNAKVHVYPLFLEFFNDPIPIKLSRILDFRHVWSGLVFL